MMLWLTLIGILTGLVWFSFGTQQIDTNVEPLNTVKKTPAPARETAVKATEFINKESETPKPEVEKTEDVATKKETKPKAVNKPLPEIATQESTPTSDSRLKELSADERASLIKVSVNHRVNQWRNAWEKGDAAQYLSFYSNNFKPSNGIALSDWRKQRSQRVTPEKQIHLLLSNFEFELLDDENKARMVFDQLYRSKGINDQSRKELLLALEQDQWRIISEQEL